MMDIYLVTRKYTIRGRLSIIFLKAVFHRHIGLIQEKMRFLKMYLELLLMT